MEVDLKNAWVKQQNEIERIRTVNPSLLERAEYADPDLLLARIGITGLDSDRPRGYIGYRPEDFIVEEICADGSTCRIEPARSEPDDHVGNRNFLHCNMTKIGISTTAALAALREILNLKPEQISYSESKEMNAITSQRISIEKVDWKKIVGEEVEHVRLEPVRYGAEPVLRGKFNGNKFTILVRDDGSDTGERLAKLSSQHASRGFVNFFGPTKFGARKISHKLGCLLARGDFNGCVRTFLTETNSEELPIFKFARERMAAAYGDWNSMSETASKFPHTFSLELKVLNFLNDNPLKTINAVASIRNHARVWIKSYNRWVANRHMSKMAADVARHETLPPPLRSRKFYETEFAIDGVHNIEHLEKLGFVGSDPEFPSLVKPEIHRIIKTSDGAVFSFSLPKNTDPHAYLFSMYKLHCGLPVPGWVLK